MVFKFVIGSEKMLNHPEKTIENELDIIGLYRTLWGGKGWIIGGGIVFAMTALLVSLLLKQVWSATAITDKPAINLLEQYYAQQQFLHSLLSDHFPHPEAGESSIEGDVYREFMVQLASYDTRREFWLHSDYFQQSKKGDAKADAARLEMLINDILVIPANEEKKIKDNVKLMANSAEQANTLLRQYVTFANQRTVSHLNESLQSLWAVCMTSLMTQIKRQEDVAVTIYQREMAGLKQGLKLAEKQGIVPVRPNTLAEQLSESDLFLLGSPLLQARLMALEAVGPSYGDDYYQNRVMLNTLEEGPILNSHFQTYRYLRTPEEPVTRESPRRLFLCIVWGIMGSLIGAGVVLVKRARV